MFGTSSKCVVSEKYVERDVKIGCWRGLFKYLFRKFGDEEGGALLRVGDDEPPGVGEAGGASRFWDHLE